MNILRPAASPRVRWAVIAAWLSSVMATLACSGHTKYQLLGFARQTDGTISFDFRSNSQRIKAACFANDSDCSDLALKAGNSVECYLHPSDPSGSSDQVLYGVKLDMYPQQSGMVCHLRVGRGRFYLMHTHECADMKAVAHSSDGRQFSPTNVQPVPAPHKEGFLPADIYIAYAPVFFSDQQTRDYIQAINQKYGATPLNLIDDYVEKEAHKKTNASKTTGSPDVDQTAVDYSSGLVDADKYVPLPILPPQYDGYAPSGANPLEFCKVLEDRYFDERGKQVTDDTVLLTVLESKAEKR